MRNDGMTRVVLFAGAATFGWAVPSASAQSGASLQQQIEELRQLIEKQQRTIGALEQRLQELQGEQSATRQQAVKQDETIRKIVATPLIEASNPRVKVAISGQVNRLVNLGDDGKDTKAYFVDNDVSVSRLRVTGTGQVTDDFSIGTNLEIAISPNNSAEVSQTNEDGSQDDEFRKVEALFTSDDYGVVAFGRGDPATKDIARLDLSGTDVLAYANTGAVAGGLFFREDGGDALTTTTVGSVFTDFDQGRTNRIRYDTPAVSGFTAAGSYGADQKWGAALRWAGAGYGLNATAGAGVQDPSRSGADLVYAGSASVLHEATGLNLTYGTAWQEQSDGRGQLQYLKAGWQHGFFEFGKTAFSIDFGYDKDAPSDGDDGKTAGVVALQSIAGYGTELFAGLRAYDLDQSEGVDTSTIYVATAGTRVKF